MTVHDKLDYLMENRISIRNSYKGNFVLNGKTEVGFEPKYIFLAGTFSGSWGVMAMLYEVENNIVIYVGSGNCSTLTNEQAGFNITVDEIGFTTRYDSNIAFTPYACYAFG